jgi:hypothetical protein
VRPLEDADQDRAAALERSAMDDDPISDLGQRAAKGRLAGVVDVEQVLLAEEARLVALVRGEPGMDRGSRPTLPNPSTSSTPNAPPIPPRSRRRRWMATKSRSSLSSTPPRTMPATPIARARVSVSAEARDPPTTIRPVALTSIAAARSSSAGSRTPISSRPCTASPVPPTPTMRAPPTATVSAVSSIRSTRPRR